MIRRVLCDTNVLVSAFIAGGPPSRVIEQAIDRRIDLIVAEPVLLELRRVLEIKLRFDAKETEEAVTFLTDLASERVCAPDDPPEALTGDPADDLILACAVASRVELLVSGDRRHLLPLGEHRGIHIVTPVALLAELASG